MNMGEQDQEIITRLASLCGIQRSYWDIWGNVHEIQVETLQKLLAAIGVDASEPAKTLERLERLSWTRLAEPVLVETIGRLPEYLRFQLPNPTGDNDEQFAEELQVELTIEAENTASTVHSYAPEQITFNKARRIDGILYGRWSVPFPGGLPVGYHRFKLSVISPRQEHKQSIAVIVCPAQAYLPPSLRENGKRAGIAISLYSLRSQRNWGIGDLGDLKEFVRWAIEFLHVDVIGLNPLHAISNRQPYNISPYFPSSRFYRNFIYLDIEAMEDYHSCPEAQDLVQNEKTKKLLERLRGSTLVQYEQVAALKIQVLERVFQAFLQRHWDRKPKRTERGKQFEAYMEQEGYMLDEFATFCALEVFFHNRNPNVWVWHQWPEPFQDPHSMETERFRQTHWEPILFYKYLQWQVEIQLQEAQDLATSLGSSIGLYHDLALGVDPSGADSWAFGDFFVKGVRVGAPPDDFALEGQDWGFYPPNRENYRDHGYELFIQEIRRNCRAGGALRIDHIMKFFRLYWIAEGQSAAEGAYVENYYQDLLQILTLESDRTKTLIIGEDLGTVPPEVRETLQSFGVFSYRIFYFERDEQGVFNDAEVYPQYALAAVNTHDLPTMAAFWTADDILLRNQLGQFPSQQEVEAALTRRREEKDRIVQRLVASGFLSEESARDEQTYAELTDELHEAILGFLLSTPAKLVILTQEDLFREIKQHNVPGTVSEYPNWSIKMKYSLEQLSRDAEIEGYIRLFRGLVDSSGRGLFAPA
ncbi:MAG: 4-alpha-glucanotransferase [Deltaproteobacteria bacterium]|nr:MAG: 4-alpha-glucanotransferase [Deltaproteobacteria bacterium]